MKARHLSSTELLTALQTLDPLEGAAAVPAAELHQLAADLMASEHEPMIAIGAATAARASSRRWALPVVTAVVVLLVVVLTQLSRSPRQANVPPSQALTSIPAKYRALAEQTNPLSAAMTVNCNGVTVPVPMLAAPGGAERGRSSSSADLRHFLAHNPFAGMGSVTNSNWLLLARSADREVFGQRQGRIGVGTAVTLTRHGASFEASSLGGCGPVQAAPHRTGERIYTATATGTQLTVTWETGSCSPSGAVDETVDRVLVRSVGQTVHILLITKPSPAATPTGQACLGVGHSADTTITLKTPLAGRTLIDDSHVPGTAVTVEH